MAKKPVFSPKATVPTGIVKPLSPQGYAAPIQRMASAPGGGAPMAKAPKGFAKTGSAKPAQFGKTAAGSSPKGFVQYTPKKATAAMQGKQPVSGAAHKTITRKDARKQFSKAPGKKVF